MLVTAMKNESALLEGLVASVRAQTVLPRLWVLADDGSTDDTLERAKALAKGVSWVVVVSRPPKDEPAWLKHGSAMAFGYRSALELMKGRGLSADYLGILDADTVLEKDYYERLISRMDSDLSSKVSSGLISSEAGGVLEPKLAPRGCARLYRMDFLDEVGGVPVEPAYETVLEIKAANRGAPLTVVPEARGAHLRRSTHITGAEGLRSRGIIRYVMGLDMLSAFAWFFLYWRSAGFRAASGFLGGYMHALRRRLPRTKDPEVREYFRFSWRRAFTSSETRAYVKEFGRA